MLVEVFVFFAADHARISVWAAFGFGRVNLADLFQSVTMCRALAGQSLVWEWAKPPKLLQCVRLQADILIVFAVPFEVRPCPGSVVAVGFIQDRNMRRILSITQLAQKRNGAIGCVRSKAFAKRIGPLVQPLQQGLG